ncbi:MAG TPA: molecular chaperone DnaJ [Elusimicrobia bacterium]|nr:MAG: molecular chaperone DnaJ [Elusimicrobia bacterium GWD2_63_28]HCC48225.1 molecular chaperone DnaJ [Elusimicrobiota bacterium]
MASNDYYRILGVPRNAGPDEIKSAYRKLAMKHHPDRNQGNTESESVFKEINEAYEVLSTPEKRQVYDQFGADGLKAGAGGGRGGFQGADLGDMFGDLFENLFSQGQGGGRGKPRSRRGADLKEEVEITLEEAFSGVKVPLTIERTEVCGECEGTGARGKSGIKKCPTCHGTGRVQYSQGFFAFSQACPDCGGQGEIISSPCKACAGAGRQKKSAPLNIKIPAGVEEGAVLRVSGGGDAGLRGGDSGDLYIQVRLRHHSHFERHGRDLVYDCQVAVWQAALGGETDVPVIDGGRVKIKIPQGTQHGKVFRVHERGMPSPGGKVRGDLLVRVKLEVPHDLTPRQRELFEELAKIAGHETAPEDKDKGFFKKILG